MVHSSDSILENDIAPPRDSEIREAVAAHKRVYQLGKFSGVSDEELGKAAGVEAFKTFERSEEASGDNAESYLQHWAMGEATSLTSWDGIGQDENAVIHFAIETAIQLYMGMTSTGPSASGRGRGRGAHPAVLISRLILAA
ncbi:hypothetical protein BGX29_002769, partial [Mortierella sp. GBA35]